MSVQKQEVHDELVELRHQTYKELMDIGAQIPAEKIILNDLRTESKFDMGFHKYCVVGWAYGGPEESNNPDFFSKSVINPNAGCSTCVDFSNRLYHIQVENLVTALPKFNPVPTKKFLEETLDFVKHFKSEHYGYRI